MFHLVSCRSERSIPRRTLYDFLWEGIYFDRTPNFDPPRESPEAASPDWAVFSVEYAPGKQPILFFRHTGEDPSVRENVDEAIEKLEANGEAAHHPDLVERLRRTRQIISIEVDELGAPDEVFQMLDALEPYLAQQLDGISYISGAGFYDANNQLIASVG
jgi:hypothetical protein